MAISIKFQLPMVKSSIRVFKNLKNQGLAFPAFLDSVFIQQKIDPFPAFFLLTE